MKNENRKDISVIVISFMVFILMVTFIVSMVLSMIGGSWKDMVLSETIMTVWTVDIWTAIVAFVVLISSIIMYNTK